MADDDLDKPERDASQRLVCFGGWAFLLLGYGFIAIIPTILCFYTIGLQDVQANDDCCAADSCVEDTDYFCGATGQLAAKVASMAIFVLTTLAILFGLIMSIVWCRRAKYTTKADKQKLVDKESQPMSAPSTPDLNVAATKYPPLPPGTSSGYHNNLTSSYQGNSRDQPWGKMCDSDVSSSNSQSRDSNGN